MNLSVNLRDLQMIVDKSGHTRHGSAHPPKNKNEHENENVFLS